MGCGICRGEKKLAVVLTTPTHIRVRLAPTELPKKKKTDPPKLFTVGEEMSSLEESVQVLRSGLRNGSHGSSQASNHLWHVGTAEVVG